jgi:hypothetical protein
MPAAKSTALLSPVLLRIAGWLTGSCCQSRAFVPFAYLTRKAQCFAARQVTDTILVLLYCAVHSRIDILTRAQRDASSNDCLVRFER